MDFLEVLKKKKYLAIAGVVLMVLGTITPYFKIDIIIYKKSISLFGYWEGKVALLCTIAIALFAFKEEIKKNAPSLFNSGVGKVVENAKPIFILVPIVIAAFLAIHCSSVLDEVSKKVVKYGPGFYFLWLGIIVSAAHAIIYKGEEGTTIPQFNNQPQMNNNQNPYSTNGQVQYSNQQPTVPNTNDNNQNTNNQF